MNDHLHACPLCYTALTWPGVRADGYPLVLPRLADVTALTVSVDEERITVRFASGLVASRPLSYSPRLVAASEAARAEGQVIRGHHLRWESIDEDLDATQFLGFPEDLGAAARGDQIWPASTRVYEIDGAKEDSEDDEPGALMSRGGQPPVSDEA